VARVLLLDEDKACDVFEVVELTDTFVKARSPFLFEIGEQMKLRIEQDGNVHEAVARVRAHVGPPDDKVTELEIASRGSARKMVVG
jgi:hypothetical protein